MRSQRPAWLQCTPWYTLRCRACGPPCRSVLRLPLSRPQSRAAPLGLSRSLRHGIGARLPSAPLSASLLHSDLHCATAAAAPVCAYQIHPGRCAAPSLTPHHVASSHHPWSFANQPGTLLWPSVWQATPLLFWSAAHRQGVGLQGLATASHAPWLLFPLRPAALPLRLPS